MKILLVTSDFASRGGNPWLLDDFAVALGQAGHEVDVLVHNAKVPRPRGLHPEFYPGISVFSVGTAVEINNSFAKLASFIFTSIRLHTVGWKFSKSSRYDLCIFTSIGVFSFGFPTRIRRRGISKRLLFILWDFFPIHQIEIGRLRWPWLNPTLKHLEWLSIREADVIATMSPANERFPHEYHSGVKAQIIQIPPWASRQNKSLMISERSADFTAVFGGQLVEGRGVDTLLLAAKLLQNEGSLIKILIAGDGSNRFELTQMASTLGLDNVEFSGGLLRSEYRDVLRTAHIGIAVTVPGVSPPSFPSKIVEYCANGLPVIVCVEESSDAGKIIEANGAGIAITAGDPHALAQAIGILEAEFIAGTLDRRAIAANAFFESELSVNRAVERIEAVFESTST